MRRVVVNYLRAAGRNPDERDDDQGPEGGPQQMPTRAANRAKRPLETLAADRSPMTAPITTDVAAIQVAQARLAVQAPPAVGPGPSGGTHAMMPRP